MRVVVRQLSNEVCVSIVPFLSGPLRHVRKEKRMECVRKNECLHVRTPGDYSFSDKLALLDPRPVRHVVFFFDHVRSLHPYTTWKTDAQVAPSCWREEVPTTPQTVTRKRKEKKNYPS